jgi:hypothetical protein
VGHNVAQTKQVVRGCLPVLQATNHYFGKNVNNFFTLNDLFKYDQFIFGQKPQHHTCTF